MSDNNSDLTREGTYNGIDVNSALNGDTRNVRVDDYGDMHRNGTYIGNVYEIQRQQHEQIAAFFTFPSSQSANDGAPGGDAAGVFFGIVFIGLVLFIGMWCYVGYQQIHGWWENVTWQQQHQRDYQVQQQHADVVAKRVAQIEGTQRFQTLRARFGSEHAAEIGLIQSDINLLYGMKAEAYRNAQAHPYESTGDIDAATVAPVAVSGSWDSGSSSNAQTICLAKAAAEQCVMPGGDQDDPSEILFQVDKYVKQVASDNCFHTAIAGSPVCRDALAAFEMSHPE